ncbi:hypothetical protein CGGC5_v012367 [Colletotrichum fructicola Nara gc5]|uniref:Uncharacterized protein n=1 Tax=Colletotrichum fructicola (strain Nara gc5) TaxID=1213859 RepID=A0A7J6IQI2_COLFN|nr:hypothetical protein CGGC5_v012367 [Colletotrichum fructicola Nara gc5]
MQNGQTTLSLAFASPKDSFVGDHQFSPQNHLPGHPWFDPIEICSLPARASRLQNPSKQPRGNSKPLASDDRI